MQSVRTLITFGRETVVSISALQAPYLELLFLLFSKQKLHWTSTEEQQELVGQVVEFLQNILGSGKTSRDAVQKADPVADTEVVSTLRTLGTVVYENGSACTKSHPSLLALLLPLALSTAKGPTQLEARRMSLICLSNLCVKTGTKALVLQKQVAETLMASLVGDASDEGISKIISSALRGLELLINESKAVAQEILPALLPLLQVFCLQTTGSSPQIVPGLKQVPRKQLVIPSDSEMSDGENGLPRNSRLQLNALLCLQSLAKAQAKLVFPYWFRFLPDPIEGPAAPSLITVMRESDSPKVRHGACAAISTFLDGSKQYLSVAEDSQQKSSFTTLSGKLAEQLKEIHQKLIQAVQEETWPVLLAQEIKCLSCLIRNCTYDRLRNDYRRDVFRAVVEHIPSEDLGIKAAVFECVCSLLDANMPSSHADVINVLELVLGSLQKEDSHLSIQVAGLELFCALARTDVPVFGNFWERLQVVLAPLIASPKEVLRAASYKLIEQYAHSCSTALEGVEVPRIDWWLRLVDDYVHKGIQDPFFAVRSLAVDCLGHIPAAIFAEMPSKRQYGCLALALGMVQDDEQAVRAAACRTLGVYVSFPAVMEDVLFLSDVATTLPPLMSDGNVSVRIRASWAIGNLSDALAHVSQGAQIEGQSIADAGITPATIIQIIQAAILAAKDNDKCRSNGTRALGNIIQVCPQQLLQRERNRLIKEVIIVVTKNVESGTVKTRWNACHALQNMLRTPGISPPPPPVFAALERALLTCRNFKVRISAAAALTGPQTRADYGEDGPTIVRGLMRACVTAHESVDDLQNAAFGEYKYREQLAEQLYATFVHLYTILRGTAPDMLSLLDRQDSEMQDLLVRISAVGINAGPDDVPPPGRLNLVRD
ncbi:HEAT repeat-containing protein 6 [Thoreauomyces humboldtii]|nr:HEAT repeat-containing protein 6 [Thoreauomyces humboldtii]